MTRRIGWTGLCGVVETTIAGSVVGQELLDNGGRCKELAAMLEQ